MISLEDFHKDFLQKILSDSESRGLMKPQSFFENVCEELISIGDLTNNYTCAEYTKKGLGLEVHGYDYDEERQVLSLLVHQFFQEDAIETLTKNKIDIKFKRLENFWRKCISGIHRDMEETSEAYSMAYQINQWHNDNQINKLKLIILTDGKATRNLLELPNKTINKTDIGFRVVDIAYLHKLYLSENSSGIFEVETNLSYLEIDSTSDQYQSYLSYMSGNELVKIYSKFGQKLFEQNVRTFLQFRGNVNKGLKNTIEYNPQMFFAYNNGITATATDVELSNGYIKKIHNLQIVNGAQTTSAIFSANKSSKLDVSDVSVQMKLSVVKNIEKQSDFVSRVSEFANTQNKINKSDFFSNSPFHKEFKAYSKRIWVSTTDGLQRKTHWFYERVRGEYLNEQAYLTPSNKKQFQLENPKKQFFDKTFLSKSENAWLQKPHIVSKGAQYSFAEFAKSVTAQLEKDAQAITEIYFKYAVCRVILFRSVETIVSQASWYNGGFRSQTVVYSIAYLSYLVESKNKFMNFSLIWDNQSLPEKLDNILKNITESIYSKITNPPVGWANIAQWCKQENCWKSVKELNLETVLNDSILIDQGEEQYRKKEDKKEKRLDSGIEIQSFVIKLKKENWTKLQKYYKKDGAISPMKLDILNKYCSGSLSLPSERQSKILYELHKNALDEGWVL